MEKINSCQFCNFSSMRKSFSLALLVVLVSVMTKTTPVEGYKILVACLPGKSHAMAMGAVCRELAKKGHEVHYMVGAKFWLPSYLSKTPNITIERFGSPELQTIDYDYIMNSMTEQVLGMDGDFADAQALLDQFFQDDSRQLLLHSEDMFKKFEEIQFDIAVIDGMFMLNYMFLVPLRLRIPWISVSFLVSPFDIPSPVLPSFVPSKLSTYTDVMTFSQRIMNAFYMLVPIINKGKDPAEDIMQKYRKYGNFQTSHDLVSQSQLFITVRDSLMDYPMPTMPNMVHAGGLSVEPASGLPLPEHIEQFMSSAKDGVILMTFGTLAKYFPKPIAEKYIAVFRQLENYKIVWRFDNRDNLTMPDNVLISEWLPQNDLLGDKRVKLFITHCGNNGQFEALYHAVPMIGFPIFIDQGYNCKRIENKGYGIAMNIHEFTPDQLLTNIKRILFEDSFRDKISKASEIYRSAKESPPERAAYWIEHVIKYGGEHLKASGRHLNVFQYLMLDIAGFLLLCIVVVLLVATCFIRMIIVKCFCRKSAGEKLKPGSTKNSISVIGNEVNGKKVN